MPQLMKGNVWHERCDARDRKGNPIVTYPVMVEDKHDEIRCHVLVDLTNPHDQRVKFLSYAGKPLANMDRFCKLFSDLAKGTGYTEFDMGFECNGNFNDSYRWVRSTKGVPEDLKDATFKFFMFGLSEQAGHDNLASQLARRNAVAKYATDWVSYPVLVPDICWCDNQCEVDLAFHAARRRGLEGVMVKQAYALYERKRTDGWLKMKPEDDADGVIIGLHEAVCGTDQPELSLKVGDKLGRIGSVTIRMADGSEASPHGIPHELGRDMLEHPEKYIGQWAEMKYMERDRQGGYRHPTFHRLREAK